MSGSGGGSIRIPAETLRRLREESAERGEPIARLAQRYIDEGLKLDRHPGIVFRDGPSGRRAVVAGGRDVWEVIAAARTVPERGDAALDAIAERTGAARELIMAALRYYTEFPDEIDGWIALAEDKAEQRRQELERKRRTAD